MCYCRYLGRGAVFYINSGDDLYRENNLLSRFDSMDTK